MPFAATRMDLEIIILSEISQTKKGKYHMVSSICGIFLKRYKSEVKALVTQLCLTLFDFIDHSPPGSSIHGILQTRILV